MPRKAAASKENTAPKTSRSVKKTTVVMSDSEDQDFDMDIDSDDGGAVESEFEIDDDDDDHIVTTRPPPKSKSKPSTKSSSLESTPAPTPLQAVAANNAGKTNGGSKSSASSQYQRLSQLEHVLKRPDTYIGSVEMTESKMWVYDEEKASMVYKSVTIVPGLYKIFDEILVNAADNKIRDPKMDTLEVEIDADANMISIYNNGRGIPIEIHEKEKMYIPELIFGNLLTSSNYDDDEKKVTGGRNGYGAKLCNIFSTEFVLETADGTQKYIQSWTGNMGSVSKPKITKATKKTEYTKITFKPDLAKFGMEKIDGDMLSVMKRRIYDLAGSVTGVKVLLNKQRLKIKNFKEYTEMFVRSLLESAGLVSMFEDDKSKIPIVYERVNDRWEIAFAVSDGNAFNQVSFVNSIATTSGGTHVNYVADQIVAKVQEHVKRKNKAAPIRPVQIKNNMFLFVNCLVENPAFTSQTKEQLTTKVSAFGSKCQVSDDFMKKVMKTPIIENVLQIAERNADKELKKQDGGKKKRITGMVKLTDANKAGTAQSKHCTLILTEGDSAATIALAGLAVVGRDYYGVFPLRGKLLNVREASYDQITKNAEIQAIKQIIGLQHKKVYTSVDGLRYGHIMIMTDQDHDGSHIKGLVINFLEASFPGLLQIPGFLVEFITPIIKVSVLNTNKKVQRIIPFFTMPQYEEWRETVGKTCLWRKKYYKGLGTSDEREGREYFSDLPKHMKEFEDLKEEDKPYLELAFSKKMADARKDWLRDMRPGTHLDPELTHIPIADFINKELILFSMADNIRSIPSVMDGFKPGQRKILYGCFKRNLVSEVRVAQLGGYISENTAYHHGEASLYQTIVGLAQDFVGSNNLYFLMPRGSFGSRNVGGKDASAPRYIFTELNPLTRRVFNKQDDPLYKYMEEDESTVEPEWYAPIIPTLLVNGAEGIGTGWSTSIPSYNPEDLITNIRHLMNGEDLEPMVPWYRGWTGSIEQIAPDKFRVSGIINQVDDSTVEITELPVKMWTQTMKQYLLNAIVKTARERAADPTSKGEKEWVEDMTEEHGIGIKFVVTLTAAEMQRALSEGLLNRFKLTSTISLSNLVAFDPAGRLKRYRDAEEILRDYYDVRLELYQRRKDYIAKQLEHQLVKLSEQARFVKLIIDGKLKISNRKKNDIIEELESLRFPRFDKSGVPIYAVETEIDPDVSAVLEELEEVNRDEAASELADANKPTLPTYEYLLGMALWSLTFERYEKLLKQKEGKEEELMILLKLSAKDLWNQDLDAFLEGWAKFLEDDQEQRESLVPEGTGKRKKKPAAKRKRKTQEENDADYGKKKIIKKEPAKKATAAAPEPKPESPKSQLDLTAEELFADDSVQKSTPTKPVKSKFKSVFAFSDEEDDDLEPIKPARGQGKATSSSSKIKAEVAALGQDETPEPVPAAGRSRRNRAPAKSYALTTSDVEMDEDEEQDDSVFMVSDGDD